MIKIKPDAAAITRQTRFVESAIHRSQDVPLNIRLHIFEFRRLWPQLARKMLSVSQSPATTDDKDCRNLETWLNRAFRANARSSFVFHRETNDAILYHMRVITGQDGWNLRRLRSLTITFHWEDLAEWTVEKFFYYDMPILEELIVLTDDGARIVPDIFRFPAPQLVRVATNFDFMLNITREDN